MIKPNVLRKNLLTNKIEARINNLTIIKEVLEFDIYNSELWSQI